MRNLSKLVFTIFLVFSILFGYLFHKVNNVSAQVPGLHFPCDDIDDNEFNSLRPYQASPCGPYPNQALFCSNKLVIFESFDMKQECNSQKRNCPECDWTCNLNYQVEPHNLNITLEDSELPIMGNTQDEFDDAQKVNEYASWYLSGVNDKRENENATDDQIVNFSGPVKKLLPSMIQDAQRIEIIKSTKEVSGEAPAPANPLEQDESPVSFTDNHDQLVVDDKRLSFWLGDLSAIRSAVQSPIGQGVIGGLFGATGQLLNQGLQSVGVNVSSEAWNMCRPPLPWDNGESTTEVNPATGETETIPVPFESDLEYKKAYNEWLGKTCFDVPFVGLQCFDVKIPTPLGGVDVISNECADLWHYVPLSNNSDSEGKNYLLTGDGPNYVPSQGTEIEDAQHKGFKNALLYFSHMQEVAGLSQLLNKTYSPDGYENEKLPKTTEKIKKGISTKKNDVLDKNSLTGSKDNETLSPIDPYSRLDCSVVNVRVNEGDDLFPGDRPSGKELFVEGAEYKITQVDCHEENRFEMGECEIKGTNIRYPCPKWINILDCPAEVGIEFKTGTKTPLIDDIFSQTVADSGSTFRKIFPKVEEGAPVECIADIPTTTNVTYSIDNPLHQAPAGGEQEFRQTVYPADGANSGTQLTFPHVGSVYEYFLKGIQTALRPKGYGEPITNGNCRPQNDIECGKIPELPKASGACNLGGVSSRVGDIPDNLREIISSAAETYKVQPNLIVGVLFGEGVFNRSDKNGGFSKFDWTEENVTNWASCTPLPNCSGPSTSLVSFVSDSNWQKIAEKIAPDLKKIDPNKTTPDPCNLIDVVYGIAWNLYDSADGGMDFQCFGLDLKATIPNSCNWNDNQIISAIKVFENGYERRCFTKKNSCATGGGNSAGCVGTSIDNCERIDNRYSSEPSHMGCVFDVAKSQ